MLKITHTKGNGFSLVISVGPVHPAADHLRSYGVALLYFKPSNVLGVSYWTPRMSRYVNIWGKFPWVK
jgi:hypothetical protein